MGAENLAPHWHSIPGSKGAPKGACLAAAPRKPQSQNLKDIRFVDIITSGVLHYFPFSQNQRLKSIHD
jgi:hypothetical protein